MRSGLKIQREQQHGRLLVPDIL